MARKKHTVKQRFQNASSFIDHLKLALEFHTEPVVLADYSPLATPYFLGSMVDADASAHSVDWGQVLCTEVEHTVALLWNGSLPEDQTALMQAVESEMQTARSSRYDFLVLELNYFKRIVNPPPPNQATIYNDILHISRATHDRHLREAVERLGELLLQRLRPTVRLESPTLRTALIGREDLRREALHALEEEQSIALVGVGGVGKTTLGTWLIEQWVPSDVFWFTIRPHFNDRLPSLLFAFGHFLHQQGASGLWLQLVADNGKIEDANLALGLALADIESLPQPPLVCLDEVDLLRADDPATPNPHHAQILEFVAGLRHHTPLLLIGQRALLESDLTLTLDKLSTSEIGEWLQQHRITYTERDLEQLEEYTGGNPRLLMLCLALHQTLAQPELAETLVRLPHTPALAPIWDRVRRRLLPEQRQLLNALSVFRDVVPRDAWKWSEATEDPIAGLIRHHLVQEDGAGGIVLLPALRTLLYDDLSAEGRERLHIHAAHICATRGEITEAAYHLGQGDRAEEAVKLWYPQRQSQIERGFAGAALEIFSQISGNRLKPAQQRQLALLRAELYEFVGEPEKLLDNLAAVEWPSDAIESIEAMHLWGVGLHAQGDTSAAQEKLEHGINVVSYLFHKYAQLYVRRGEIYLHERSMKNAWREAKLARYHAEHLQGTIQNQMGHFEASQIHYQTALALAQELEEYHAIANTYYHLGIIESRQHEFPTAFAYFEQAVENYRSIGNRAQEMYVRSNQAACHILAEQYSECIDQAQKALAFYERINSPYWIALNACNIAEAHVELGNLTDAEEYAFKTIQQEETDTFAYGLWILARVRHAQHKPDEAIDLLTQAIQIAEENEDRWQTAYSRRTLGEIYADTGEMDEAKRELNAALDLFRQMELTAEMGKTQGILDALST